LLDILHFKHTISLWAISIDFNQFTIPVCLLTIKNENYIIPVDDKWEIKSYWVIQSEFERMHCEEQ